MNLIDKNLKINNEARTMRIALMKHMGQGTWDDMIKAAHLMLRVESARESIISERDTAAAQGNTRQSD
jgi:hypothetical protein